MLKLKSQLKINLLLILFKMLFSVYIFSVTLPRTWTNERWRFEFIVSHYFKYFAIMLKLSIIQVFFKVCDGNFKMIRIMWLFMWLGYQRNFTIKSVWSCCLLLPSSLYYNSIIRTSCFYLMSCNKRCFTGIVNQYSCVCLSCTDMLP